MDLSRCAVWLKHQRYILRYIIYWTSMSEMAEWDVQEAFHVTYVELDRVSTLSELCSSSSCPLSMFTPFNSYHLFSALIIEVSTDYSSRVEYQCNIKYGYMTYADKELPIWSSLPFFFAFKLQSRSDSDGHNNLQNPQ